MSRKLSLLGFLMSITSLFPLWTMAQNPIQGRVIDGDGKAISYATVVISEQEQQIAGNATDEKGEFSILVEDGEYTLTISYVGYKDLNREVKSGESLGDITLEEDVNKIEGVVVTTSIIRREADRFIVDVANAPSAIGKDGEELLKSSPGVWISDDKISINGNAGPKIFVNDRELKLSSEQVMIYLRNLKSEDVKSIEVIPQSGADFDANSSSGIIMIYLKRQRESGLMGNVSLGSSFSEYMGSLSPSVSINYQSQKFTLNTSGWYHDRHSTGSSLSSTKYTSNNKTLIEKSLSDDKSNSGGGKVEAIYEINKKHSIGADLNFYTSGSDDSNTSTSVMDMLTTNARGSQTGRNGNISTTFNYIFKIDSVGSTLKFLADYNNNSSNSHNINIAQKPSIDSTYISHAETKYQITSATLALEKIFSPKFTLKSGLKFTRNDMDSQSDYDNSSYDGTTTNNYPYPSEDILANENIGAAYVIGSSKINRFGFVVGLRSEYTYTQGYNNDVEQSYFSWFPNANISYSLDAKNENMITAQYSRSISRPSFWSLNPERRQSSEYMYQIGNPLLKPSYSNRISLSYTYKYRYNLYLDAGFTTDGVQQVMLTDETNPEVIFIRPENMASQNDYSATLYLPFQIAKWWSLNTNITYDYRGEKLSKDEDMKYQNILMGNIQTTFTLPKKFFIDIYYFGMNSVYSGNIKVDARHMMGLSIKKRFYGDRFTVALKANNLLNNGFDMGATTDQSIYHTSMKGAWTSRTFGASLSYNFKAGKEYQQRGRIESSADMSRMATDSKQGE